MCCWHMAGGSIKKNGVYEELMDILNTAGKKVTEFSGIMPNPAYKKVQEGAALVKENKILQNMFQ